MNFKIKNGKGRDVFKSWPDIRKFEKVLRGFSKNFKIPNSHCITKTLAFHQVDQVGWYERWLLA